MLPVVKYPLFIESILPRFASMFNQSQLRHFAEYVTGLIVSENKTVTSINSHFLAYTDQSAKNHFLTDSSWNDSELTHKRFTLIIERCQEHRITDGLLVIDDTIAHKSGKQIDAVDWFWDHSSHSYTLGHQVVSSQFVTRDFHVPLDYRLYRKEEEIGKEHFKSKLDLAIELIDQAIAAGIPFKCVVGDSGYFCDKIIKHLEPLDKDWIFAAKSNRTINVGNRWIGLKDFTKMQNRIWDSNRARCVASGESVVTGTSSFWHTHSLSSSPSLRLLQNGSKPMSSPLEASVAWSQPKLSARLSFGRINTLTRKKTPIAYAHYC